MTRRRPNAFASVTVRWLAGSVGAPDIMELPPGVWSTIPATPGVLTAIRSGALEVKKTKRIKKATSPRAPGAEG